MGKTDRRKFLLTNLVLPIAAGAGGGILSGVVTAIVSESFEEHHSLSISILKAGSAVEPAPPEASFPNPFIIQQPSPTPTPDPNPEYGYTAIVRNDGDFPEQNVTVSIGFHSDQDLGVPLSGPDINSSSPLLGRTIRQGQPAEPVRGYGLNVVRLNPGE